MFLGLILRSYLEEVYSLKTRIKYLRLSGKNAKFSY
jgi:hypothetical protein